MRDNAFLRLNPLSSFFPRNGHWDLPPSAAIARCVLDTYLRMFYFGVKERDEAEGLETGEKAFIAESAGHSPVLS